MTAPRRIVLLAPDGKLERVLCEPPAIDLHAELRRQAALHPGRRVCGEWDSGDWRGWVRFLEITK